MIQKMEEKQMEKDRTRTLVLASLMAALTYITTTVVKIPTPTMGYVHIGDSFVLLSGILLGPVTGGLSAGIGSMLSDLLGGYPLWAPGTFTVKLLTAMVAGQVYKKLHLSARTLISGIAGEAVMIVGYFLYNIVMLTIFNAGSAAISFSAAALQSFTEIPFNVAQAVVGIAIAVVLLPALKKLPVKITA